MKIEKNTYHKITNLNVTKSFVYIIKHNLLEFQLSIPDNNKKLTFSKNRLVESKVSDEDIRGAVRILSSNFGLAPPSLSSYEAMKDKHPPPSPTRPLSFPSPPTSPATNLTVSADLVLQAIATFPNGSSGGIDGLRPQHLKDLLSSSSGDAGRKLLLAITNLCNFMLSGKVNAEICNILYGASLIALEKKDGELRPISVGKCFVNLSRSWLVLISEIK